MGVRGSLGGRIGSGGDLGGGEMEVRGGLWRENMRFGGSWGAAEFGEAVYRGRTHVGDVGGGIMGGHGVLGGCGGGTHLGDVPLDLQHPREGGHGLEIHRHHLHWGPRGPPGGRSGGAPMTPTAPPSIPKAPPKPPPPPTPS